MQRVRNSLYHVFIITHRASSNRLEPHCKAIVSSPSRKSWGAIPRPLLAAGWPLLLCQLHIFSLGRLKKLSKVLGDGLSNRKKLSPFTKMIQPRERQHNNASCFKHGSRLYGATLSSAHAFMCQKKSRTMQNEKTVNCIAQEVLQTSTRRTSLTERQGGTV